MTYYHYISFDDKRVKEKGEERLIGVVYALAGKLGIDYKIAGDYILVGPIPDLPEKPPQAGMFIGVCPIE